MNEKTPLKTKQLNLKDLFPRIDKDYSRNKLNATVPDTKSFKRKLRRNPQQRRNILTESEDETETDNDEENTIPALKLTTKKYTKKSVKRKRSLISDSESENEFLDRNNPSNSDLFKDVENKNESIETTVNVINGELDGEEKEEIREIKDDSEDDSNEGTTTNTGNDNDIGDDDRDDDADDNHCDEEAFNNDDYAIDYLEDEFRDSGE